MRKPRSRWRERARAWKKGGRLHYLVHWSWTGDSGALLGSDVALDARAHHVTEEGSSTVPCLQRGGPVRWRRPN